jgi:hypothetical protein
MAKNATSPATPSNRLGEALRAGGRRTDWLARKTGYSVGHVSRVANGHLDPSDQFIRLVCSALDLPQSYVFPGRSASDARDEAVS